LLQKRVDILQKRLEKVEVQHTQMRRARVRSELPRVALVGYTNAGKSTLFNALTGAEAYAADKLFATLDPMVRRIDLQGGGVVLADTVGFVRDLPHELVAAFRSTLSEAREADLLVHVIDADDPLRDARISQVDEVLTEIGAGEIPQLMVFNKIDRIEGASARIDQRGDERVAVWLSARDGIGLDLFRQALGERLGLQRAIGEVWLPTDAGRLRARLHALDAIRGESHDAEGWHLQLDLPMTDAVRLAAQDDGAPLRSLLPAHDLEAAG
jgi:GTP-binding protein HflX